MVTKYTEFISRLKAKWFFNLFIDFSLKIQKTLKNIKKQTSTFTKN